MPSTAGVVVAGGRSSRMGAPKADLAWHGSTLLRHVTGVVQRVVDGPVVVVRAPDQELPQLDPRIHVVTDEEEGKGPMMGLAIGLRFAASYAPVAFVCSTDLPFLHPAFVAAVLRGFETDQEADVVLPYVGGYRQPMAAGYRTDLAPHVEKLIAADRLRPAHLFEEVSVRRLDETALPAMAPSSVRNVNTPEEYAAALAEPQPEVTVERFGVLAQRTGRGPVVVRAANVGAAAEQVGLPLDRHILAAINGDQIHGDGLTPLVAGDRVSFLSADAGG